MKTEEFLRYMWANRKDIEDRAVMQRDLEANGCDEYYKSLGEEIERNPLGVPRRRRGS